MKNTSVQPGSPQDIKNKEEAEKKKRQEAWDAETAKQKKAKGEYDAAYKVYCDTYADNLVCPQNFPPENRPGP